MPIWLQLWWYNNVKRHYWNWWASRHLYREWIAEGRDPHFFPRSGKITRESYDWAADVTRKANAE